MRRKLDRRLAALDAGTWATPVGGWLIAVRRALGMSKVEWAQRMGVSNPRAGRLERAEVTGSLQLKTLRRAAEALNCRLVYVLVPDEPLEDMVFRQAYLKAVEDLTRLGWETRGSEELSAEHEEELEARILQLVDSQGLWRPTPTPVPTQT